VLGFSGARQHRVGAEYCSSPIGNAGIGTATLVVLAHNRSMLIDYSQHGQALILQQLITADTPRVLVDIGAHDGITGSNSRALIEQGWHAVLVEPYRPCSRNSRKITSHFRM
jgi:hypothetical protein